MSRRRYDWDEAIGHLKARCGKLGAFIDEFGPKRLPVRKDGNLFRALARAIAYQQLSGKAAATIHGRFENLFDDGRPDPLRTVNLPFDDLRGAGLSQAKSLSIMDLAEKSLAGALPGPHAMGRMSDGEIIDSLCEVRGIGPWTAQMYLIFNLGRPDVMPASDLGIQKGVRRIYRMRQLPGPEQVLKRTRHLAPFRSAASWYFWRASELPQD